MQSNRDRIKEMIEHISTFNDADPGEGISRFSYSENDAKARKYLIDINKQLKKHGGIYGRNRTAKN